MALGLAGLALLSPPAFAAEQPNPSGLPATLSSTQEDSVVRFRQQLGFPADSATISKNLSIQRAGDDTTSWTLGPGFTAQEVAEVKRRSNLTSIVPAIKSVPGIKSSYGGVWIDNLAGGVLDVGIAGPVSKDLQSAIDSVAAAASIKTYKVVSVANSQATLTTLQSQVNNQEAQNWGSAGWQIQSTDADPQSSHVVVNIASTAPAGAEAAISAKYGSAITVQRTSEMAKSATVNRDFSGRGTDQLLYGGTWIQNTAGYRCTVGYSNVRDKANGQYYTLTAGHCGREGVVFNQGSSGRPIGREVNNTTGAQVGVKVDCDCMVIGQIPSGSGTETWYINNNVKERFTGIASNIEKGQAFCQSGVTTMMFDKGTVQCGTIQSTTNQSSIDKGYYTLYYGVTKGELH